MQCPNVLPLYELGLKRFFAIVQTVGYVAREVFPGCGTGLFVVAQLVNDEVVCYTDEPGTELTCRLVFVAADGDDGPCEGLLEDVLGTVFTTDKKGYVGIYIILMPLKYDIESTVIALFVQRDQFVVGHCIKIVHYASIVGSV